MKVTINSPAGPSTFVEGVLKGIVSEQDGPAAHIEIEISIAQISEPSRVILSPTDLRTIVRLAKGSGVESVRDAII